MPRHPDLDPVVRSNCQQLLDFFLRRWLGFRRSFYKRHFGIAESTGAAKLKEIRTMLRIRQFDHHWSLPSRMDDNPMAWMVQVNGFLMDVRDAPREVQEIAFQKGLIPYIPAEKS